MFSKNNISENEILDKDEKKKKAKKRGRGPYRKSSQIKYVEEKAD